MPNTKSAKELAVDIPEWGCCELGCLYCPAKPPWQQGHIVDINFLKFSDIFPDVPRAEYEAKKNLRNRNLLQILNSSKSNSIHNLVFHM